MTVRTPVEALDHARAFVADLPGKVFRSIMFAFGQTGNLLALGFMFVLGVVGQPIAGPYLARYGLPITKADPSPPMRPDAVLGQIQRLQAIASDQMQAVADIKGSIDGLRTQIAKTTPLDPPPVKVRRVAVKPQAMPSAPVPAPDPSPVDAIQSVKDGIKSLLPKS